MKRLVRQAVELSRCPSNAEVFHNCIRHDFQINSQRPFVVKMGLRGSSVIKRESINDSIVGSAPWVRKVNLGNWKVVS